MGKIVKSRCVATKKTSGLGFVILLCSFCALLFAGCIIKPLVKTRVDYSYSDLAKSEAGTDDVTGTARGNYSYNDTAKPEVSADDVVDIAPAITRAVGTAHGSYSFNDLAKSDAETVEGKKVELLGRLATELTQIDGNKFWVVDN